MGIAFRFGQHREAPLAQPVYRRRVPGRTRLPWLRSAASPALAPGHPAWCPSCAARGGASGSGRSRQGPSAVPCARAIRRQGSENRLASHRTLTAWPAVLAPPPPPLPRPPPPPPPHLPPPPPPP